MDPCNAEIQNYASYFDLQFLSSICGPVGRASCIKVPWGGATPLSAQFPTTVQGGWKKSLAYEMTMEIRNITNKLQSSQWLGLWKQSCLIPELWWRDAVALLDAEDQPRVVVVHAEDRVPGVRYEQDEDQLPLRQGQVLRQQDRLHPAVHQLLYQGYQVSMLMKN